MICVRCGHDSKYKERIGMCCPGCRGEFAFEPRQGALFTDKAFAAAIDAVSGQGQVRWGAEHLYYEVCRRRKRQQKPRVGQLVGFGLFFGFLLAVGLIKSIPLWPVGAVGLIGAGLWWMIRSARAAAPTVPLTPEAFDAMWQRWTHVHGKPKGLIVVQSQKARPPRAGEPDLGDYSFDRAVICDRARTVDLLLANNFHFENNCAVLSIGGYPQGPFETVRRMLKRNPRLQVFALHDASDSGCKLAYRLASDPAWFKGQVPVTDVGLRPVHAEPFRGLWRRSATSPPSGEGIAAPEAAWLSQYTLELAAIRPEQVLKRMFRAINRKSEAARGEPASTGRGDSGDSGALALHSGGSAEPSGGGGVGAAGYEFSGSGQEGAAGAAGLDFDTSGRDAGKGAVGYDFDSFSADATDSDGGADSFG